MLCGLRSVDHRGLALLAVRRHEILKISDLFPKQRCHELHLSCQGLLLPKASQLEEGLCVSQ